MAAREEARDAQQRATLAQQKSDAGEEGVFLETLEQARAGTLTATKGRIAAAYLAGCSKYKVIQLPVANLSNRGTRLSVQVVTAHRASSHLVHRTSLWRRSKDMMQQLQQVAGTTEASGMQKQLAHYMRANWDMVSDALTLAGRHPQSTFSVDEMAALQNEMSASLAEHVFRFLRERGVQLQKREALREHYSDLHFELVAGDYTCQEEKKDRKGRPREVTRHGPYTHCKSLLECIRMLTARHVARGTIEFPGNVPPDRWPVQLLIDRGNLTTRLVLKLLCVRNANSVKSCLLIGVLDHVKDTHSAIQVAFGEVFAQMDLINQRRTTIEVPYFPAKPVALSLMEVEH